MGFVPGYENDVFISYAHADNEPLVAGKPGWVDFFEDLLRKRVKVRLRGEIQFFRDQQLRLYGQFSDQLAERLARSAVFVCIPSPNYVESDWCLWELENFHKQNGTNRIFKAVKTYIDAPSLKPQTQTLLKQIDHVLDSRFYVKNESSGLVEDLLPDINPEHIPPFLQKVDVIAQNLVELLKKLREQPAVPSPANLAKPAQAVETSSSPQVTVYLAETTKDLAEERNSIKSELLQFNYRVLPEQPLPQDAEELAAAVRGQLQQARLSIHLLGAGYGLRPEGEDRSIPHIQYDLAAESNPQAQIIWLPPGLMPKDKSQEAFIAYVKDHSPDTWQSKLEDLKTAIQKKLQPAAPSGWDQDEDAAPVNVCLFCHEQDLNSVRPLYSHLTINETFQVKLPLKEAESLQNHKQLLQSSDAVILYYGSADQDWFVNIWRLIQRHSSTGRTKPILAKAIYTGQPPTIEKDLLDSGDPLVLKNYGQFTPDAIEPFVEKIRAAKGDVK
ncbi:MAG TPA: TIR domain-containing protein [Blastocatellia bacterium]